MIDDRLVVREVSWRDLFPWLILFRVFRIAISPSLLLAAGLGVLAMPAGWRVGQALFVGPPAAGEADDFARIVEHNGRWPGQPPEAAPSPGPEASWGQRLADRGAALARPFTELFAQWSVEPFRRLFRIPSSARRFAYFLWGGLWTLLVWSLLGGAITRAAVVRLGREERIGLREALDHSGRRLGKYFSAPLLPLLGVAMLAALLLPLGWLMLLDVGVLIAGLFWFIVLLLAVLAAILLLGLLFGWPLMWGAISAEERGDAFDALSRCYAFTFQRPLCYLFYAALALMLGALGWLLVSLFAEAVIHLGGWLVSWGANVQSLWRSGPARLTQIQFPTAEASAWLGAGAFLISAWERVVRILAAGFVWSYFWCAASAIYLLLRRDVDQTELDEVYLAEDDQSENRPLTPLPKDEAGVPGAPEEESAPPSEPPKPEEASEGGSPPPPTQGPASGEKEQEGDQPADPNR